MKKVNYGLISILTIALTIFACNSENVDKEENLTDLIDKSPISKSKLNDYYNKSKSQKSAVNEIIDAGDGVNIVGTRVYTPPTTVCRFAGNINYMSSQNLVFTSISQTENVIYSLRDKELLTGNTGLSYIKAFYEISKLQEDKNFSLKELELLSSILPKIADSYKKLNDVNYNGIIIDNQLKSEITSVINFYKTLPSKDQMRYTSLINAVEEDLENIDNRNREQILYFLKN
jgi:hypothetical protein